MTKPELCESLRMPRPDEYDDTDHEACADAIEHGCSLSEALAIIDQWPDTYFWLKANWPSAAAARDAAS